MRELRKFERFILNAPARLYLNAEEKSPVAIQSIAHDISSNGAFIYFKNKRLQKNTNIDVEIILTIDTIKELFGYPNEVKLRTRANIARNTYDGIGIRFTGKSLMISNAF